MSEIKPVVLTNPETAALYTCTYTVNCYVHVPGNKRCLISDVTPQLAQILISQGHKAFIKKEAA